MKNKTKILQRLYDEKHITFEELEVLMKESQPLIIEKEIVKVNEITPWTQPYKYTPLQTYWADWKITCTNES